MNENEKITIKKEGKEVECEVLFTFDCEANGKSYVGYTDHEVDSRNRKNIYVSSYDPVFRFDKLEEVTTEEEKEMIEDVLNQIRKDAGREGGIE